MLGDHRRPCAGAPVPQTGYLEPLLAGATLAISPLLVLFAVFFWSFLWGIPGALRTGHYCDANNVRPVRRQSLARGATLNRQAGNRTCSALLLHHELLTHDRPAVRSR